MISHLYFYLNNLLLYYLLILRFKFLSLLNINYIKYIMLSTIIKIIVLKYYGIKYYTSILLYINYYS